MVYDFPFPSAGIVLIGMAGIGKSHWSARYGLESSTEVIRDTASETRESLDKSGAFFYISADNEIASFLWQELSDAGVDRDKESVEQLAEFIGKFGSEQHGGLSREVFLARQDTYRSKELKSIEGLKVTLESAYGKQPLPSYPQPILYDTTGSFCEVVRREDSIYEKIKQYAIVVYLACSEREEKTLLERQLANPKPMLYDKSFFDTCLREYREKSERSDGDILPNNFLQFIFPAAMKRRRKLYEDLAQVTITTAELEAIYNEERPEQFSGAFIRLVFNKYNENSKI